MNRAEVICNSCGRDLTETTNSIAFRLALFSELMPCYDGPVTDAMISPELPTPVRFCGARCLKNWINARIQ